MADGAGNITSFNDTSFVNGTVYQGQSNSGSYTVNADCTTGTLTFMSATRGSVDYDFVFVNGGTELFFTGSDQGEGISGSAQPSPLQCDLTTLNGAYGFHLLGYLPSTPVGAIAESGLFVANRGGVLTLINDTISVNGAVTRGESNVGAYTVNADCTGTLLLRSATSGNPYHDFVIVNDNTGSNELFLTGSNQAAGFYGSAKAMSTGAGAGHPGTTPPDSLPPGRIPK